MRTLNDIFWNHKTPREILFEDGLWCMYRRAPYKTVPGACYVIHRCSKVSRALNHDTWVCGNRQKYGCGETAPEGIQALYILNGWDER